MIENTKQAKALVKTDVSRRTDFLDENFMETKFKGTKGSWSKINTLGNKQDKDCFYKVIRNENDKAIAEVKGVHYGIPNEECIHNAKLISNVPELVENLIKAVVLLKQTTEFEVLESFEIKVLELEKVLEKALS
jgi:hypothetical protein